MKEQHSRSIQINMLAKEIFELRRAGVLGNDLNKLKFAISKHKQVAELFVIEEGEVINPEKKVQCRVLRHYNLAEYFDGTLFIKITEGGYEELDTLKEINGRANYHLTTALQIIDKNFNILSEEAKNYFRNIKEEWLLLVNKIKIDRLNLLSKDELYLGDLMRLFDYFTEGAKLQKEIYEYQEKKGFDQAQIRHSKAAYISLNLNISQVTAGIIRQKVWDQKFNFDVTIDLIKQFLKSMELSYSAFSTDPENELYRFGAEEIRGAIKTILKDNKPNWNTYLTELNSPIINTLMNQIDNKEYKRQLAKNELQGNSIKRFLITGAFWLAIFGAVAYFLLIAAQSIISWYRFLGVIFFIPLVFTVIGAFVLRSTDGLKEENFMKLMQLALKINFQGLKVLAGRRTKEKENDSESESDK